MEQRRERAGVHHEPRRFPVHGAVHVKIETVADMHRDPAESAEIETWHVAGHARIRFQDEQLSLAIDERLGRKQNVGAKDSVDLVAFTRTAEPAEIDEDQRFVDEVEIAQPNILGDRDGIEGAVNAELRGQIGLAGDGCEPKVFAAIERDRAHGRTGVDAEESAFAIHLGPDQQVILSRTDQRQRFVLQRTGTGRLQ